MRRWILKAGATDLNGLEMQEAPRPEPGPGEVRIRVHAVSLNFRDQIVVKDLHWRLPDRDLVPVSDGAGEIDAVGSGVTAWSVGDKVVGLMFKDWPSGPPHQGIGMGLGSLGEDGMLSEYVVLPAERVAKAPASLDMAQAATLPCAGVTAWSALYGDRPVKAGDKVLVLGSGGVALFALLLAHGAGAQVTATSSQDDKLERMRALGATGLVNYKTSPEWGQAVLQQTGGGVDKVIDSVGNLNQSLTAVRPGGEIAVMGLMGSDGPPNPALLMGKAVSIRGVVVGNAEAYRALAEAVDTHALKPPIHKRFAFDDAKAALEAQASPDLFGKIVVEMQ